MGRSYARKSKPAIPKPYTSTWQGILDSFGHTSVRAGAAEIPPDNIFVPIQQDNILPSIPIGRHHPVPKKGVEDDDTRTMNTNKFYVNAFLGDQGQAIWTHPYSIWWGRGWEGSERISTWGMCITHTEENDLEYGTGDPADVSALLLKALGNILILRISGLSQPNA
jgi:endo-1,3(4)-beta-glucanase